MECRLRNASPDTISLVECKRLHEWNRLSTFKMLEAVPKRVSGRDFWIGSARTAGRGQKNGRIPQGIRPHIFWPYR